MQIIEIIITIITPIILVAGLGAVVDRTRIIEARSLSQIIIYLASPALAFFGIANATIDSRELAGLALAYFLSSGLITLLAWLIARWLGLDRLTSSAFILSVALINVANYGIPLNEFAFGQPGLERAIIIGVLGAIYAYTVGIFVASSGQASLASSLTNILKLPLPYAAGLGLAINLGQWPVPGIIMRVTGLLGDAAVPLMLVMLGIQVSRVSLRGGKWRVMVGASLLRLLGGAAIGFIVGRFLGLEGATYQVTIVQAAMPSAVISGIFAVEFNGDSQLVSSTILLSTLLSVVTLPFVIAAVL